MEEDDNNSNVNNNPNGDFSNYSQSQCVDYLASLNDPSEPFYSKEALNRYDLLTLQIWCKKAFDSREFMIRQGLMEENMQFIPKQLKMVRPPTAMEIIQAHQAEEKESKQEDGLEREKSNNNNNSSSNSMANGNNDNDNGNRRGKKRPFGDIEYGLMPDNQGFELVSAEEAARFRARGFAAVKSEVDKLIGIQFFKKINGNGQVFYCQLNPDGSSRVCPLPQQRPMAFDSDDDINDEGFQNNLNRDPFFGFGNDGRPPKRHRSRTNGTCNILLCV